MPAFAYDIDNPTLCERTNFGCNSFKNDISKNRSYFIHNFDDIGNTSTVCAVDVYMYITDLSVT